MPVDKHKSLIHKFWEWIGHIHVATWLYEMFVALWPVPIMSTMLAIGSGYWAFISKWGYLPTALVALGVFVAGIWGLNGIIWLRRQRRPSKEHVTFDYSYGLALEEVVPSLDLTNINNTLEIRLKIRNHATGPIKFLVEEFHTTIEDRFWTTPVQFNGVLPRMGAITLFPGGGFKKDAFDRFEERTKGRLKFSILYGHPDDKLSRRTTKILNLNIFKRTGEKELLTVVVNWTIESETDVAI